VLFLNADQIKQQFPGYAGWNDNSAIEADFRATGGSGKGGSTGGGGNIANPIDMAKQLNDFQIQANQPAISSLQASKAPLEQRYSDLINNIKGNQTTATNQQTVTTNNELGRRGITGGGLYDQSMTNSLAPIGVNYSNLLANANTGQSSDEAAINNAIAQLQAGNPSSSISGALQYTGIQNQANQFQQSLALQQQQEKLAELAQSQNYGLSQQNYSLEQQKLAQSLAQQQLSNQFTQQQLGISGGNLGVSQANQALAQKQFDAQYGSGSGITPQDLAALQHYLGGQ
jgi:hypothetical protein